MSREYRISVEIDAKFTQDNIGKILSRGSCIGFVYYKFLTYSGEPLNLQQATLFSYKGDQDYEVRSITINFKDTYADLTFSSNENILITVSGLSDLWSKDFKENETDIDVARYIKILLDLIYDFRIISMVVEKS